MKAYRGYGAPIRDSINDLDCPQCGGWFPSFTSLADHVTKIHPPVCSWCGDKHHGDKCKRTASREVTDTNERETNAQHERERDDMAQLPRSTRPAESRKSKSKSSNAGRIPGSSRAESNDYNPFLKSHDIGKLGATAKLTLTGEVRVSDGMYGEQIIAEARLGKVTYDWPIKLNSPNHRELEDTLGLNTTKWRNKVIVVEVKEHMGRDYIAIQRARAQSGNGRKTKKTKRAKR